MDDNLSEYVAKPTSVCLGSFPGGLDILVIPPGVLERAHARLDAESKQREMEAEKAKVKTKPQGCR